ncbi:cAMP-dependent protein kinase type 1-like [Xenopus laevis]|uniref:cAMP-dependent protein kinase type 1-like n=1 Tax=Xenopus laevis TaxID=8355 RepID=A0A8J1MU79_XENLA|nr:cAMP-dependent protein kinase type 1-like [Xenopus laevis]
MDLSEKRNESPAGQVGNVVKSCIEERTNKDWIRDSGETKTDAEYSKKSCINTQTSQDRRRSGEKQTEHKEKTIKRRRNEDKHIQKESQAEKTSKDGSIERRKLEEGQIVKENQAEKTSEDERIKSRGFEEGQIEKESQAEKKSSKDARIKRRRVEETPLQMENLAYKKTSEHESYKIILLEKQKKKITEENTKGTNIEQKEERNKRSRAEDPLESGSIQKRPCLDIERPAPLDINSYNFHTILGRGGFGWVMLASFRPNKQLVAMKILKKKSEKNDCHAIAKEARLLKISRECAFLCHSYAVFQSELESFFVMEYASGNSLWEMILRERKLPTSRIMFYTAEMVVALQFLHSKGIIHRDLKPENILIDKDGHIKICDFGIAEENIIGQRTAHGLAGTPGYRAPEILLNEDYNAAVDWWSFGVTMYKMATGVMPFSASGSIQKQLYTIIMKPPNYPCDMNEEMLDLLPKLLEIDETERIGLNGNIREHAFYSNINWEDLENRRLETPFQPGMPPLDDVEEYPMTFSPQSSNERNNLKDFSEVDPNWNWQE